MTKRPADTLSDPSEPEVGQQRKRVLVTHSHCHFGRFKDTLRDKDLDMTFALNGLDGLREFHRQKGCFDAIISGIIMPQMDGYTFLAHIRSMTHVPVIILTISGELDEKSYNYFNALNISHVFAADTLGELHARLRSLLQKSS